MNTKQRKVNFSFLFLCFVIGGLTGEEVDYFTVLNSLTDTRANPRFRRLMSLRAAGSDMSEKARKSLKQKLKEKTVKR